LGLSLTAHHSNVAVVHQITFAGGFELVAGFEAA